MIVYIEEVPRLPGALEGRMMMLPTAHGQRYVRIQIALRGTPDDVDRDPRARAAARDRSGAGGRRSTIRRTLTALYQRIGIDAAGHHVYDTLRGAGSRDGRVRRELLA